MPRTMPDYYTPYVYTTDLIRYACECPWAPWREQGIPLPPYGFAEDENWKDKNIQYTNTKLERYYFN